MADDTELGPAVISTAEPPNGGSAAILYQQPDAKMVSIGYLQDGSFVGGPNLAFFTPDALNGEKILEYRVNQMHRGSSLLLSKTGGSCSALPRAAQTTKHREGSLFSSRSSHSKAMFNSCC